MVDFRKKLLGLAGALVAFAGLANAQGTLICPQLSAPANFIRAEGQTELLPTMTVTCTTNTLAAPPVATPTAGTGLYSTTLFFSPSVTVTSAVTNAPSTGSTEALITANGTGASVFGTLNGGSVVFTNLPVNNATTTFTIYNIRINATSIPINVGQAPTGITAQAFNSGTNVTPGPTNAPQVAFALNGFTSKGIFKDAARANTGSNQGSPYGVCGSINNSSTTGSATASFFVGVDENFQSAFKTKADEASGQAADTPSSGTRIQVTFSNVATGLNIFMPISNTAAAPNADGAVLTAQVSATAPTNGTANNQTTAATSPSSVSGLNLYQVPVANGAATAIYEVTTDNLTAIDSFNLPVFLQAGTNAVTNQSATMTVQVSFAPITAANTIPSFAVGSSTVTANAQTFSLCTTSLLFPFVTNQAGFETGIAIANTSKDPFGSAKPQSGTCTLNYYGTSATNPTATVAPNTNETSGAPYLSGETYAFTLTNALAATTGNPATFQGYVIAACNFQFAHGFAYIVYNFPGTSSDTMGYLALSIGRGATGPESAGH